MYSQLNYDISKSQMEKLYRAIFCNSEPDKYKLRLCAAYNADMKNGLRGLKSYMFPPESSGYLPNPHIQRHACIGGYAMKFQEYIRNKDYVGAVNQAAASARNLNFYDSTVMTAFARDLSNSTSKCIEKSDGMLLTPIEAIEELERRNSSCQDQ